MSNTKKVLVTGARGRNSDNMRIRELLGWAPSISLETGLARTYEWIQEQLLSAARISDPRMTLAPVA